MSTTETPALSPSIALLLITESPLHAWEAHRLLGGRPRPTTTAQESGQILHAGLLEDWKGVMVLDVKDFKTKAAREDRDKARNEGFIPVTRAQYDKAVYTVGRLKDRMEKVGVSLTGGEAEMVLEWNENHETGDVLCHGRIDYFVLHPDERATIYDVKTTDGSVSPRKCALALSDGPGAIQAVAYRSAAEKMHPYLTGRVRVVFLFCETRPPYAVTPVEPGDSMWALGESRWKRAITTWGNCLAYDQWPGHATEILKVQAPPWALQQWTGIQFISDGEGE